MLGRAVQDALTATLLSEEDMYSYSDDTLLDWLSKCQANVVSYLSTALRERRLHKILHKYSEEEFESVQSQDHECNALNKALAAIKNPNDRRALEDRLADEIGADHGQVIIYAPELKMNMKAADMKVLWKGEPKPLKEIDDPITEPRLKEIMKAHQKLWGFYIICSRQLTEQQCSILRKACDAEFVTTNEQVQERRIEYYQELVELQLSKRDIKMSDGRFRDFSELRKAAAKELADTALDRRPWKERLEGVISKHFPSR